MSAPPVTVFDNLLPANAHAAVWAFLSRPGWSFGGYSADESDRYFYKHFAGYVKDGQEDHNLAAIEDELAQSAPIIHQMWLGLKAGPLAGQMLSRCYANAMSGGVEGGVHLDSNIETHLTSIYYPHPTWNAAWAGETLLFNPTADEIIAAVYPKPNRLAVFAGTIPHVARPMSRRRTDLRITLMFKTMPA